MSEEDKERIRLESLERHYDAEDMGTSTDSWELGFRVGAEYENEYWQCKLKALKEISEDKGLMIIYLESKLKERDELFVKDLKELRERLIGECQPWLYCCTKIDNGINDLLTRYSNLKAK